MAGKLADILDFVADKEETTTEAIVQHFGFPATSAKRYLRQLAEFGYLEAQGGNRNRTYSYSFVSFASSGGRAFMSANPVHPTRKKKRNPAMGFRPALVMVFVFRCI